MCSSVQLTSIMYVISCCDCITLTSKANHPPSTLTFPLTESIICPNLTFFTRTLLYLHFFLLVTFPCYGHKLPYLRIPGTNFFKITVFTKSTIDLFPFLDDAFGPRNALTNATRQLCFSLTFCLYFSQKNHALQSYWLLPCLPTPFKSWALSKSIFYYLPPTKPLADVQWKLWGCKN